MYKYYVQKDNETLENEGWVEYVQITEGFI